MNVLKCTKCKQEFVINEEKCKCGAGFEMVSYTQEEILFLIFKELKLMSRGSL